MPIERFIFKNRIKFNYDIKISELLKVIINNKLVHKYIDDKFKTQEKFVEDLFF